jgi:hypothetical protein
VRKLLLMRPRGQAAALALYSALAVACSKEDRPAAARPAASRIIAARKFAPPSDGLLTDSQIDRYIAVRRAARGRTEADAAQALAVDPDEQAWVRARVLEAFVALDEKRVRGSSAETYTRTLAKLHETRAAVKDPLTARTIDEQIAALEKERAAWKKPEPSSPSTAANARRLEKRRAEIEAAAP